MHRHAHHRYFDTRTVFRDNIHNHALPQKPLVDYVLFARYDGDNLLIRLDRILVFRFQPARKNLDDFKHSLENKCAPLFVPFRCKPGHYAKMPNENSLEPKYDFSLSRTLYR